MKYIKTCTVRISMEEIQENPSRLEDFYPGLFVKLKDNKGKDKDFLILELARYFYNDFTKEITLTLVVQDIMNTDIDNEKLVRHKKEMSNVNIKIKKNLNLEDKFDINDMNPGSYFYNKTDDFLKIKEIYGLEYDKENNILSIYAYVDYIHGFGHKEVEDKKREIKRSNFKIHVQD